MRIDQIQNYLDQYDIIPKWKNIGECIYNAFNDYPSCGDTLDEFYDAIVDKLAIGQEIYLTDIEEFLGNGKELEDAWEHESLYQLKDVFQRYDNCVSLRKIFNDFEESYPLTIGG